VTHSFSLSTLFYVVEGSDLLCRLLRDATKEEELKATAFVDLDALGNDGWMNLVAMRRLKKLQEGAIFDGWLDG